MNFEIVGKISNIEIIAVNVSIRELAVFRKKYGGQRWRKLKGTGLVSLESGNVREAELPWHEAHGIGKRKIKIKQFLD